MRSFATVSTLLHTSRGEILVGLVASTLLYKMYLQFKNMHPDEPSYFLGYHHLRKLGKLFPSETFVQVIPGSSDKLMIFFQGGGACFNDVSTQQAALCLTKLVRPFLIEAMPDAPLDCCCLARSCMYSK